MKKFKHRKTGEIATYKDGVLKSSGFSVEIGVEPSSKYWEEIIEKDYEILSLARFCSIKPKITDVSDYGDGYIEALLKCDNARIHSVKRLSDSKIFTIGDNIQYYDKNTKIKSIYYNEHNQLSFKVEGVFAPLTGVFGTSKLEKVKEVLFTTEDGVDIFEGDEFWFVNNIKNGLYLLNHTVAKKGNDESKKVETIPDFSTKEKAEEYILLNKPCLSINDINKLKCLTFSNWDKFLKESVKSKL